MVSVEDARLKERTILLMRLYWLDTLHEIGLKLEIPKFQQVKSYWELNHYQAALELARHISDHELVQLVRSRAPKYELQLGGFRGQFYTADTAGNLELKSSWNEVRQAVRTALERWGDRAYGILQALVNKKGRSAYFDLIEEISKVLGYDFIPSFLLPRLQAIGLVFKTGSNKYPDWTVPTEIIPIVREELNQFARPPTPQIPRSTIATRALNVSMRLNSLVDSIVAERARTNLFFKERFGFDLLRPNERAINDIRKPCSNEGDFTNRILALSLLLEVDEKALAVPRKEPSVSGLNRLHSFLKSHDIAFDEELFEAMRTIRRLRSFRYPVHDDQTEVLQAMRYFGAVHYPIDWETLWETVLSKYLWALQSLAEAVER